MMAVEPGCGLVEVPPGNAVHRGNHGRRGAEQRGECWRRIVGLMCFKRADYKILRTEGAWIVSGCDMGDFFFARNHQLQAAFLNGLKMRTARDDANFMTRLRELNGEISADRTCAKDTKLHASRLSPGPIDRPAS